MNRGRFIACPLHDLNAVPEVPSVRPASDSTRTDHIEQTIAV
jgi:hypothetical protein